MEELFPLVYEELRKLAAMEMASVTALHKIILSEFGVLAAKIEPMVS